MKKEITIYILIALAVIGGFVYLSRKNSVNSGDNKDGKIVLYYGDGCPHCAIVERFMEDNNVESKLTVEKKEVYHNQTNAQELAEKAQICGLPTDKIGVPLLWNGNEAKCVSGDEDIVNFFKDTAK